MRFGLLGSGSEGNALLLQCGKSCLLMDCGFALAETTARLARFGIEAGSIDGILVTHEHGDHISGVVRLARKYSIPVWMTHGTYRARAGDLDALPELNEISPHESFAIGDIHVQPYAVPHDAAEPVQYVFGDGAKRLGVLTDAGCITPHIEEMLQDVDALVLECNHDAGMLANGAYPRRLKERVGGRLGHLSNADAATLLGRLRVDRLQHVVAAHLSKNNNLPELAVRALSVALSCSEDWIGVASQQAGLDWRSIL